MRIWFEGWSESRFEGGLKLGLNDLAITINVFVVKATTFKGLRLGLKVGLINFITP